MPEADVGVELRVWVDASSFGIFALNSGYKLLDIFIGERLRYLARTYGAMRILAREGDEHLVVVSGAIAMVVVGPLDSVAGVARRQARAQRSGAIADAACWSRACASCLKAAAIYLQAFAQSTHE